IAKGCTKMAKRPPALSALSVYIGLKDGAWFLGTHEPPTGTFGTLAEGLLSAASRHIRESVTMHWFAGLSRKVGYSYLLLRLQQCAVARRSVDAAVRDLFMSRADVARILAGEEIRRELDSPNCVLSIALRNIIAEPVVTVVEKPRRTDLEELEPQAPK